MATEAEKSLWLTHLLENDPEAVELRERTRDWADSNSFGLLKKANFTSCSAHLDRQRVLELVYQHLHSIGMHHVAFTLAEETQNQFQRKDQQFDRTDLRLLISMSLGPRDNLWDNTGIENTVLSEERSDIDNFSVHYVEPLADLLPAQEDSSISFVDQQPHDFSHIEFAPLHSLIRILVGLKKIPFEKSDAESFFLMLNTMCKSVHFVAHLQSIYNSIKEPRAKRGVIDFIAHWVNYSAKFIGTNALHLLEKLLKDALKAETNPESEISKTITSIISEVKSPDFGKPVASTEEKPAPAIGSEPAKLLNPNLTLADPEPVEMARQISLAFHEYYAAIPPREFYAAIATRELSQSTPAINEMVQFGQQLKLLIAATVLSGDKKKAETNMEKMVTIAKELLKLNNYEALSWVVSAFDMRCLENLSGIREKLSAEANEDLKKILNDFDWHKPSPAYEEMVEQAISEKRTAIPSLRYELSIGAADLYGGEEFGTGKINWEKRQKAALLIKRHAQFQNTPYNFHKIGQIQNLLKKGTKMTKDDLNKNSINIESPIKPDKPEQKAEK